MQAMTMCVISYYSVHDVCLNIYNIDTNTWKLILKFKIKGLYKIFCHENLESYDNILLTVMSQM